MALADLDLADKRVLMRVDFNVPLKDGSITDDTRIRAAVPSIQAVLKAGGRPVLMTHLGRPKGQVVEELRLDPVGQRLGELLGSPVGKLNASIGSDVEAAVAAAPAGSVVLLENVRFHAGETKGDAELSAAFAKLGDVFVSDAFGTAHRAHCSVAGVAAHLPSYPGLLMGKEIEAFDRALKDPARPFVAVLGGAKVSDKLPVIDNLIPKVDAILVGGAMAYTFLQAMGFSTGTSRVEEHMLDTVRKTIEMAKQHGVELGLPSDHVCAQEFSETATAQVTTDANIEDGWMGLDIGPKSQEHYATVLRGAKTIVWNGPMGVFEWKSFQAGTKAVALAVADSSGFSVVGGGDSVAAVGVFGLADRIGHISTGGGASLELLGGEELPGLKVLQG